jgi:hypothetical protein
MPTLFDGTLQQVVPSNDFPNGCRDWLTLDVLVVRLPQCIPVASQQSIAQLLQWLNKLAHIPTKFRKHPQS